MMTTQKFAIGGKSRTVELSPSLAMGGVAFALALLLWLLMISGNMGLLATALVGGVLLLVLMRDKQLAVLLTLAFLLVLGDVRRIVSLAAGQPSVDPLLLIAPGLALLLAFPYLLKLRLQDRMSNAVLGLLGIMVLEIANPLQGGLNVGFAGVFFYIVPLLWFWIGRGVGSPQVVEWVIYRVVLPLALAAAALGLCQTFIGFPPYQQTWIQAVSKTYTSLFVGSSVRAFGFSVSAAEYATLMEFSLAAAVAAWLAGRRAWALAVPVLAAALVFAAGRTLMLKVVVALAVIIVIRRTRRLSAMTFVGMGLAGVVSLAALSLLASQFAPANDTNDRHATAAQSALSHQFGGLAHPFDQRYSSAGLHSNMVTNGLAAGFIYPLGRGLGATTFIAARAGGDDPGGSSEIDFSDMFICLGALGGFLYLYFTGLVLQAAYRYVRSTPLDIGLPVFAILVSTLGAWMLGGQYSSCALAFFLIGALVHRPAELPKARASQARTVPIYA